MGDRPRIVGGASLKSVEKDLVAVRHDFAGEFVEHLTSGHVDTPCSIKIMHFERGFYMRVQLVELIKEFVLAHWNTRHISLPKPNQLIVLVNQGSSCSRLRGCR